MPDTTTRLCIFNALMQITDEYNLALQNRVSLATDDTPNMTDVTKELTAQQRARQYFSSF